MTPAGGGTAERTVTIPVAAAGPGSITWDGRGDDGAYVPDGDYTLTLTPLDRARNAGPSRSVDVAVFGSFVGLSPLPARFYPQDGDAIAARSVAKFTLKRAADVTLHVVNAAGTTIRTISGPYPAGAVAIAWDGRTDAGGFAPQGAYRVLVAAVAGDRTETHTTTVRAAAFELRPSVAAGQRGKRMSLTVVTSETLKTKPKLTVRQPGLMIYAVAFKKVGPSTWKATWTLKATGRAGKLTLTVKRDRHGRRQERDRPDDAHPVTRWSPSISSPPSGRSRPCTYGSSCGWSGNLSATGSPSHDVAGVAR